METSASVDALVDGEIGKMHQIELAALAQKLRISSRLEDRPWDYGSEGQSYACWIVWVHVPSNTAIAYCSQGFGPSCPWGLLHILEPRNMGMDCQWFVSLEDALRESVAWEGANPPGYEVP
jgi:hypothetical protein